MFDFEFKDLNIEYNLTSYSLQIMLKKILKY